MSGKYTTVIFTDNVKIIQFTTVTQCRLCRHGQQLENGENVLRIHIKNMDIRHLRKSCYRRVGLWPKRNRVDVGVSSFVQLYAGVMRMRKPFTRTHKRELPVAGIR